MVFLRFLILCAVLGAAVFMTLKLQSIELKVAVLAVLALVLFIWTCALIQHLYEERTVRVPAERAEIFLMVHELVGPVSEAVERVGGSATPRNGMCEQVYDVVLPQRTTVVRDGNSTAYILPDTNCVLSYSPSRGRAGKSTLRVV